MVETLVIHRGVGDGGLDDVCSLNGFLFLGFTSPQGSMSQIYGIRSSKKDEALR